MGTEMTYIYKPDYAVHPGEYLEEVLESREIRKKDLAERLGISDKHLSQIINKQALLTSDMAVHLERALGVSANIWSNINAEYALFEARQKEAESLNRHKDWIKKFPVLELSHMGYLPSTRDPEVLLEGLLDFFGIPSPDRWEDYYHKKEVSFRKSDKFKDNLEHIAAWLRAGELKARGLDIRPINKDVFKQNLFEIRKLTLKNPLEFEPLLKNYCAQSGVALVFIPEFRQTHISGATRWLTPEKALITMSLRYKTNDHFWFTFFHEAAHILLHSKKEVYIDDGNGFESEVEEQANRFAADILIPDREYREFAARNSFTAEDVARFSREQNIHPAIVVGRLQHDKRVPFNTLNDLKEHFELKG